MSEEGLRIFILLLPRLGYNYKGHFICSTEGKALEHGFWHNAWEHGKQGWHQKGVNQHLETWWHKIGLQEGEPVFVPLCGKSLDMLWLLDKGHSVVGVELNESAVAAFFEENLITHNKQIDDDFTVFGNEDISILVGDFFKLNSQQISNAKLVFDRAALIALPPEMRKDYAAKMADVLPAGAKMLLITMVYDQSKMSGPPFSVADEEVNSLFAGAFNVEKLESSDDPSLLGGLANRGLETLRENCWLITKI